MVRMKVRVGDNFRLGLKLGFGVGEGEFSVSDQVTVSQAL